MSVVSQPTARKGRWPELVFLILALAIGLGAYVLVYVGVGNEGMPSNLVTVAGAAGALTLVSHLVVRHVAPYADPVFFPAALALNGLGLAMIYRVDIAEDKKLAGGQMSLTIVGVLLMVATVLVIRDHRWLRRFTWISLILGALLLLLPMAPGIGRSVYGARIWINVAGFSYQPAELAKIFFAIFFAGYLVSERDNLSLAGPKVLGIRLPTARHFVPILLAWLFCMGTLAVEKDFGTALLFFGLFVAMLYVATERVSWLIIGSALTVVGIFAIVHMVPHIQARFVVWLHALDQDVYSAKYGSYQLVQGMFGMASGGLFGTGLGKGYPDLAFAANSDFIIASFGEELGLTGLLALLSIYLIIIMRGLRTATLLRDGFGKLFATGLSFTMALQCLLVVGGVTRLIPLTGLAMPFLAHGGSALLTNWIIIGLLLRMSDAARRPASTEPLPPPEVLDSLLAKDIAHPTVEPRQEDAQETHVVRFQ